jgi:cytochrome c
MNAKLDSKTRLQISAVVVGAAALATSALTAAEVAGADAGAANPPSILIPQISSERGKALFANKACVVCHSVNNVGGAAAPALDADDGIAPFDPLNFAARMWRGADTMIVLQGMELGYQIELSGQEIGDLAAFVADKKMQQTFAESDVPEVIREWFLEYPIELNEDEATNE